MSSLGQQLLDKKADSFTIPKGYTEATAMPMGLMFNQPNNTQAINFKMENINELSISMLDILKERSQTLDFVMRETMSDIKAFFAFDSKIAYEITDVPYSKLASVRLQNIIGLKANIFEYTKKLNTALDLAINILEFELNGLTKLIAQLLSNKDAITSNRPISAIADLKMHSTDVEKIKNELAAMIGHEAQQQYVEFGSIYYSLDEWKDCNRIALNISQQLKKAKLDRYAKDIKNLTALMDKLIIRIQGENIPRANIEDYSKLVEETSNNVAFAGATIHMSQTLIQTLTNHNEILKVEIDDYKKHRK